MTTRLQQLKEIARQLTRDDIIEANLRMFEGQGLDINDIQTMAESVGLEVEDLLLLSTRASVSSTPRRIVGTPGRRDSTKDIADFAAARKKQRTWNEIFREWNLKFPDDDRVQQSDTIREAYRRHYGDKAGKPY
jgi:hypothetical protein